MFDRIAFGALVRRKRGRESQQALATRIWNDPGRKGDISRIENGKVTPQEQTVQYLCEALHISEAEMDPIRRAAPTAAALDHIAALSLDDLRNLAYRFEIADAHDRNETALRDILTKKAEEYRAYRKQIDGLDDRMAAIANLKGGAQDAAERLDFDTVEELLAQVTTVEAEIFAESTSARAQNALLRGRVDQAYTLFCAAADATAVMDDPLEPARRRHAYFEALYNHGLRYGGPGLQRAIDIATPALDVAKLRDLVLWAGIQQNSAVALQKLGERTEGEAGTALLKKSVDAYEAALTVLTKKERPESWARTQQNLANALMVQGIRTDGKAGKDLLAEAVTAYEAALTVRTRKADPQNWAATQQNLAIALRNQGNRSEGTEGLTLLGRAVKAYEAALTVRARTAEPEKWAMTQHNLAGALASQASRTDGIHSINLFNLAQTAWEAALAVHTREAMPHYWAETQENLALLHARRSQHGSCDDPQAALRQALTHVEAALEVYDPEHASQRHAEATGLREDIRAALTR